MTDAEREAFIDEIHLDLLRGHVQELRSIEKSLREAADRSGKILSQDGSGPTPGAMMIICSFVARAYAEALEARISLEADDSPDAVLNATRLVIAARNQRFLFGIASQELHQKVCSVEDDLSFTFYAAADLARALIGSGRDFIREAELRTHETLVDAKALLHQLDGEIAEVHERSAPRERRQVSAEALAVELLLKNPRFKHLSSKEWAEELGIAVSTVRNLNAWKTARSKKASLRRDPRDVSEIGENDAELNRLLDEQTKDRRADTRTRARRPAR